MTWNLFNEFPDYRLSDVANPTRCHRCQSAIWHLLSRAGFEIRLDPERISDAVALGSKGETFYFATVRTGNSFVVGFLKSTASHDADADFEKTVHLAWHRCDLDNIRTDIIDHWSKR